MIISFKYFFCAFILSVTSSIAYTCTTVFKNDNANTRVVARSMDLFTSDSPMILVEPRGSQHTGDIGKKPLTWTSKYGNVVINAFHANAISDGINEKGLAAHLLYLTSTQYPTAKPHAAKISNAVWAQYILDNFSTVDEALNGTKNLQIIATKINGRTWPIHLTMEDATGDSAIIEFINGKMQIYHGSQYQVMTNEPAYNIQLANLKRYQGFGGKLSLPGDTDPLSRFVRVATYLKTLPTTQSNLESIANILSVMRSAMVPFGAVDTSGNKTEDAWATRWVTVADLSNKIYYFNSTSAPNIIWIDLNKINFTAGSPMLTIDPTDIHLEGDISKKLMPQ